MTGSELTPQLVRGGQESDPLAQVEGVSSDPLTGAEGVKFDPLSFLGVCNCAQMSEYTNAATESGLQKF